MTFHTTVTLKIFGTNKPREPFCAAVSETFIKTNYNSKWKKNQTPRIEYPVILIRTERLGNDELGEAISWSWLHLIFPE